MMLSFTKMHGLGNDFVVINAISQKVDLTTRQIRSIAKRHFGIGCDQVLLVEAARSLDTDFYYRIFNADGFEVEQCGNGARCFASFVKETGLSDKETLHVGTLSGNIHLRHEENGWVKVNMGAPKLEPALVPFEAEEQLTHYPIEIDYMNLKVAAVSMGNPHAVLQVESVAGAPVQEVGELLECHERFPQRVNVGFMEVKDRGHINLRVYERGAAETLACGSGACAAVVAGRINGLLDEYVEVKLPGGVLMVSWAGNSAPVWMSGPAVRVFEGKIEL